MDNYLDLDLDKKNNGSDDVDYGDLGKDVDVTSLEELKEEGDDDEGYFDQDADNPPAGTPGHPGIDEDTA